MCGLPRILLPVLFAGLLFSTACDSARENLNFSVTIETKGDDPDEDGYTLLVDGQARDVGPNEMLPLNDLGDGLHTFELTGLAKNCSVQGPNPRSMDPAAGDQTIRVSCILRGYIYFVERKTFMPVGDIYRIRPDGSDKTQITAAGGDGRFDVTRDGTRIVLARYLDTSIRILDLATNAERTIFDPNTVADYAPWITIKPAWSPDGSRFALGLIEISIANADGTSLLQVTDMLFVTNDDAVHQSPSWSPDGSRLAFGGRVYKDVPFFDQDDDYNNLYTVNADGSGLFNHTAGTEFYEQVVEPAWSPVADEVVFVRQTGEAGCNPNWSACGGSLHTPGPYTLKTDLYVRSIDGTSTRQLTHTANVNETEPQWRPDGEWIVYAAKVNAWLPTVGSGSPPCVSVIMIMRSDGTDNRQITECDPVWLGNFYPVWVLPDEE